MAKAAQPAGTCEDLFFAKIYFYESMQTFCDVFFFAFRLDFEIL